MLTERQHFLLPLVSGGRLEIEINFSDHENVRECGTLRCKVDDKEFDIKTNDLVSLILGLGRPDDLEKMIPVKHRNVKIKERKLTFEFLASQDYKKGEKIQIVAPWIDEQVVETNSFSGSV